MSILAKLTQMDLSGWDWYIEQLHIYHTVLLGDVYSTLQTLYRLLNRKWNDGLTWWTVLNNEYTIMLYSLIFLCCVVWWWNVSAQDRKIKELRFFKSNQYNIIVPQAFCLNQNFYYNLLQCNVLNNTMYIFHSSRDKRL